MISLAFSNSSERVNITSQNYSIIPPYGWSGSGGVEPIIWSCPENMMNSLSRINCSSFSGRVFDYAFRDAGRRWGEIEGITMRREKTTSGFDVWINERWNNSDPIIRQVTRIYYFQTGTDRIASLAATVVLRPSDDVSSIEPILAKIEQSIFTLQLINE